MLAGWLAGMLMISEKVEVYLTKGKQQEWEGERADTKLEFKLSLLGLGLAMFFHDGYRVRGGQRQEDSVFAF